MIHSYDPRTHISGLLRQKRAAFFLIEENNRTLRKSLMLCGGNGSSRVCSTEPGCVLTLQLSVEPAVEQNEKTKACRTHDAALARPWIVTHTGRIVEPIARVRKSTMQRGHQVVPRIAILVEPDIGTLRRDGEHRRQQRDSNISRTIHHN